MSVVTLITSLLMVIAVVMIIWRIRAKRFVFVGLLAVLVLSGIIFYIFAPEWSWYSFTFSEVVESGENRIEFTASRFDRALGHYTLSLTPVDHTNRIYNLSGYFKSDGNKHAWFSRSAHTNAGKPDLIPYNNNKSVATGITIENRVIKNGSMHILIEDDAPPNRYRLSVGRPFP